MMFFLSGFVMFFHWFGKLRNGSINIVIRKKLKKKYLPTINFQHICWQKGLQKSYLLSETERGHKDFTMGICLVVVETLCPVNWIDLRWYSQWCPGICSWIPTVYFDMPLHTLWYESFSDVGERRVWFASKNLTPYRMQWNAFLIAQIIAKCHSFPNMYGML